MWVPGCEDETWWSRLAQPALHTWTGPDRLLRLLDQAVAPDDADPKALICYGLLRPDTDTVGLRFVTGQPVSAPTAQFLAWRAERLAAAGTTALLVVWDHASWHLS